MFYVKVREEGRKQWRFLSRGGTNRLRIHGIQFPTRERAQALIDDNAPDNPGWDWRVVS